MVLACIEEQSRALHVLRERHPYVLFAEADTPANATNAVIGMIYVWLQTPRAPWLVRSDGSVRITAPGLAPVTLADGIGRS